MSSTIEFSPEIAAKTPGAFVRQGGVFYRHIDKLPDNVAELDFRDIAKKTFDLTLGPLYHDIFSQYGFPNYDLVQHAEPQTIKGFRPHPLSYKTKEQGPFFQVLTESCAIRHPDCGSVKFFPSEGFYEVRFQTVPFSATQGAESAFCDLLLGDHALDDAFVEELRSRLIRVGFGEDPAAKVAAAIHAKSFVLTDRSELPSLILDEMSNWEKEQADMWRTLL